MLCGAMCMGMLAGLLYIAMCMAGSAVLVMGCLCPGQAGMPLMRARMDAVTLSGMVWCHGT